MLRISIFMHAKLTAEPFDRFIDLFIHRGKTSSPDSSSTAQVGCLEAQC